MGTGAMVKVNTQDSLFLSLEQPGAPMHIGVLIVCRLPRGAGPDFMQDLHTRLGRDVVDSEPFNLQLVETRRLARYAWKVADEVDLEYHLRHEALPWPGGARELGLAISRLHSVPLERSRPLWEFTLIEGLRPDRFALYLKIHHALGDGVGLIGKLASGFAVSRRGPSVPPWSTPSVRAPQAKPTQSADADWQKFLAELLASIGRRGRGAQGQPLIPRGPSCLLNGDSTGRRRVATQDLPLARIKAVAREADATVNDVVLALCSGALRAYLAKFDRVPKASLLASVPVAMPRAADESIGSSVASIHTALATTVADPRRRLLAIRDSMRAAKDEFRMMPASLHRAINSLGMQIMALVPQRPNRDLEHAAFTNLTISNVPGPMQRLYFRGAEIEAMYPLSVLPGDQRLNVTVLSYRDRLHFGLVACPDTLPSVQYIAVQLPAALRDLEAAMARARRRRGEARGRRRSTV